MIPSSLDTELDDLPPEARWREWMGRIEAVVFASPKPVPRAVLATLVGRACNLDLLIADIRAELRGRPYDMVAVAGGYHHRTRQGFAAAIHASGVVASPRPGPSQADATVLMAIAYFQPITRAELGSIFGKDISRDLIARLKTADLIGAGPRSPLPGAPYTYVTTDTFLSTWGFDSLQDLPDMEKLQESGLLNKVNIHDRLPGLWGGEDGELPEVDEADGIDFEPLSPE